MEKEKLVFLSHCLLNQLVRAGNSFTPSVTEKILKTLAEFPLYIFQLPCPEYLFAGRRSKKTQDVWEKMPGFRDFLSSLATRVERETWWIRKDKKILLVGIARSPCCSLSQVYRGEKLVEGKGLWIKELEKKFKFTIIEFDFKNIDNSLFILKKNLKEESEKFESGGKT